MLQVSNLSAGWGDTIVVDDVSLSLLAGETVAIVGRNGVGKTTLLEAIAGRARFRGGEVKLRGKDLSRMSTFQRAMNGIRLVPQTREVFASLTVRENLSVAARPGQFSQDAIFDLFPSLAERRNSLASQLSGGEQQMLAIGRALSGNPVLLLMDEPSEGLAPIVVETLVEAVRSVASTGALAILLVEQRVDLALELAGRCVVMDRGRIVHEAPTAALRGKESELASLMGLG